MYLLELKKRHVQIAKLQQESVERLSHTSSAASVGAEQDTQPDTALDPSSGLHPGPLPPPEAEPQLMPVEPECIQGKEDTLKNKIISFVEAHIVEPSLDDEILQVDKYVENKLTNEYSIPQNEIDGVIQWASKQPDPMSLSPVTRQHSTSEQGETPRSISDLSDVSESSPGGVYFDYEATDRHPCILVSEYEKANKTCGKRSVQNRSHLPKDGLYCYVGEVPKVYCEVIDNRELLEYRVQFMGFNEDQLGEFFDVDVNDQSQFTFCDDMHQFNSYLCDDIPTKLEIMIIRVL